MSGDSLANEVTAACVAGIVIATVAIILRMWSRGIVNNYSFRWDDYFAVLGWLFGVANCALSLYWVHVGLGRHVTTLQAQGTPPTRFLLPLFAQDFVYNFGITVVKLSLICFYARVFRDSPVLRIGQWVTAALAVAWCVGATVASICTCSPVEKQWNDSVPGYCLNRHEIFLGTAVTNILIDLMILMLPLPAIWSLQMSKVRRLEVISIFALGYGFMIVSTIRVVEVAHFQEHRTDFTWNWVKPQVLLAIEIPLGVVGICLPSIFLLVRRFNKHGWQSILGLTNGSRYRASTTLPRVGFESKIDHTSNSNESLSCFVASLGPGNGAVVSSYASGDGLRNAPRCGSEEIQVRVDIDVDIDISVDNPKKDTTRV